eukprot:9742713-Alexandrium_andersonii.AAC.1
MSKGMRPEKPWEMMRDGDLWRLLDEVVAARGPATLTLKKVKGHATQQHVEQGLISSVDRF